MSTVSSRNRRKEERKKQDLREGGVYEDIALIRALYNLITEISEISSDVRDICHILFETNLTHEAQVLQDLFKSIDEKVRNNIKEIWPDTFNEHQNSDKIEERAINENILVLGGYSNDLRLHELIPISFQMKNIENHQIWEKQIGLYHLYNNCSFCCNFFYNV